MPGLFPDSPTVWVVLNAIFVGLLYLTLIIETRRRRGRYPPLSYGGRVVSDRHQRRLWLSVFSLFLAVAMFGVGTVDVVHETEWENAVTPAEDGHSSGTLTVSGGPILYTYSITETALEDGTFSGTRTEVARIPWLLLIAAAVYWWEVVRWSKKGPAPRRPSAGDRAEDAGIP